MNAYGTIFFLLQVMMHVLFYTCHVLSFTHLSLSFDNVKGGERCYELCLYAYEFPKVQMIQILLQDDQVKIIMNFPN